MGKTIKSNTRNYNKKNKSNIFSVMIKSLKEKYPTAIDVSVYNNLGRPYGFNFRTEPNGEYKQIKFIK